MLSGQSADATHQTSSGSDDDDLSEASDGSEGHVQHSGKTLVTMLATQHCKKLAA